MTDEERQQRIHHHMYETCEGIAEHAERIVALEELCADMWCCIDRNDHHDRDDLTPCYGCPMDDNRRSCNFGHRMDELGIPH